MRPPHWLVGLLLAASAFGCEADFFKQIRPLPPAEEQRANFQKGEFKTWMLSTSVFLEMWGPPTFEHRQTTTFFVVENNGAVNYVPNFRVPLGETPPGWIHQMIHKEGRFFAYERREEMIGFVEDRFVYRERMSAEDMEKLRKHWEYEARFQLDLEKQRNMQ